jgi:hypothetical protein
MFNFGSQTIEFQCPECQFYNVASMKQIINKARIICRGCKINIQLSDGSGDIKNAEKQISGLMNEIEKLF